MKDGDGGRPAQSKLLTWQHTIAGNVHSRTALSSAAAVKIPGMRLRDVTRKVEDLKDT